MPAARVRQALVEDGDIRGEIEFQNDLNGIIARLEDGSSWGVVDWVPVVQQVSGKARHQARDRQCEGGQQVTHVLLVEDDSRIRSIVEQGLKARGFLVSSAPDGEAGLEMARHLDVELVLLDLILPGIGGIEVLSEIRTFKPRLPVILLTALDDTTSKVGGLDAGANDYLSKPFDPAELVARVRAQLRAQLRWVRLLEDQLRNAALDARHHGKRACHGFQRGVGTGIIERGQHEGIRSAKVVKL